MLPPRPFALIRTKDQWSRVAHTHRLEGEVVQLAWSIEPYSSHAYEIRLRREPLVSPSMRTAASITACRMRKSRTPIMDCQRSSPAGE